MFAQICVSSSKRKSRLQLDLKEVNACPAVWKASPRDSVWVDTTLSGPFHATVLRKGRRADMEDCSQAIRPAQDLACFAVFDGHRGATAAQYAADHLLANIRVYDEKGVTQAFLDTDRNYCEIARKAKDRSGTTALVAVISGETVIAVNVGDSRALLISEMDCSQLTYDHVAADTAEQQRVESAGGYVIPVGGVMRVQGAIAVTRGLGSSAYKQFVIPDPHVTSIRLCAQDKFLLLATDGLKMTNEEVRRVLVDNAGSALSHLAALLADYAQERGSPDNLCVTLVDLKARSAASRPGEMLTVDEDEQLADEPTQVSRLTPRHATFKTFF